MYEELFDFSKDKADENFILHLEDDPINIDEIKILLDKEKIKYEIKAVTKKEDFIKYLNDEGVDIILADYSVPGLTA